jgi:hypothetical protein
MDEKRTSAGFDATPYERMVEDARDHLTRARCAPVDTDDLIVAAREMLIGAARGFRAVKAMEMEQPLLLAALAEEVAAASAGGGAKPMARTPAEAQAKLHPKYTRWREVKADLLLCAEEMVALGRSFGWLVDLTLAERRAEVARG